MNAAPAPARSAAPAPADPTTGWAHPLLATAAARPHHPAVELVGEADAAVSWAQLRDRVATLAAAWTTWLDERGHVAGGHRAGGHDTGEGDTSSATRVALPMPRTLDAIAHLHALIWAGVEVAPLAPDATDAERARDLSALGTDRDVLLADAAILAAVRDAARDATPAPAADWSWHRPLVTVLTSGTTGAPRPVAVLAGQLLCSCLGSVSRLGHDLNDRWLCPLPLHHVGGLSVLLRGCILGTTARIMPRFDAGVAARELDRTPHDRAALDRAPPTTLVSLVPAMLQAILDHREQPDAPFPGALRAILLGGAAAPEALLRRCEAISAPVALTWGMSETASQVATGLPGELGLAAGLPLMPLMHADVHAGALRLRGPLAGAGELVTGDTGEVLGQRVRVTGRADDVLITGGENLHPGEVERVLERLPGVRAALVVGVPDERWGQRPAAVLAWDPAHGTPPTPQALRDLCARTRPRWKCPDRGIAQDDLPRTPMGKPDRAAARELLTRPPQTTTAAHASVADRTEPPTTDEP